MCVMLAATRCLWLPIFSSKVRRGRLRVLPAVDTRVIRVIRRAKKKIKMRLHLLSLCFSLLCLFFLLDILFGCCPSITRANRDHRGSERKPDPR